MEGIDEAFKAMSMTTLGTPGQGGVGESLPSDCSHPLFLPPNPLTLNPLLIVLAKRPDAGGTSGKKLQLLANVYRLRFKKSAEAGISHYDVTIKFVPGEREPGAPKAKGGDSAINRETSIAVWDKLVTSDPDGLGKSLLHACFDCKKNAFTLGRLNIPGNVKNFRVVLDPESETRAGREFDVKLQLAQEIDLSILETFTSLRKASNLDDQAATAIMALDVLLRHSSFRKPGVVIGGQGRKFLDVQQATLLGEGAHVLGGLFQYSSPLFSTSRHLLTLLSLSLCEQIRSTYYERCHCQSRYRFLSLPRLW